MTTGEEIAALRSVLGHIQARQDGLEAEVAGIREGQWTSARWAESLDRRSKADLERFRRIEIALNAILKILRVEHVVDLAGTK